MKRQFGIRWWLWVFTGCALGAHLGGWRSGLPLTIALVAVQMAHQGWRVRTTRNTLPLQVRILVLTIVLLGIWPPLRVLQALLLAGMTVLIVFDYCLAGRLLSLMPWNRRRPLTVALLRAAFFSPRRPGCRFSLPQTT
jgi:hypothetical protein